MRQQIETAIAKVVEKLYGTDAVDGLSIELSRPDERFGDYAVNVALQLISKINDPAGGNPRQIAEAIAGGLRQELAGIIAEVTVAGPGFINIRLQDSALYGLADQGPTRSLAGKTVISEYSDPNPFKVLHVGHLYTSVVGHAISNLLELAGATVHRVNFGGDVGLHVGRTMWAIVQELGGEHPERLDGVPAGERSDWMARAYVRGTQAYDDDETAKQRIIDLNKQVYGFHADDDHDSPLARIYWTCRQWSYDYFDAFYDRIGTPFEKYYPESQVAPAGLETVRRELGNGVYEESGGAVVFKGEPYGLHTRVFINSQGLPTYEAKDTGLIMTKWRDYGFDLSIVVTGNDIVEYMKVVLKSIEQYEPELVARSRHVPHGNVKLAGGVKMSSRKGNFLRAVDVLDIVSEAGRHADESTTLGAVKYAFLKQRIGADIIFNPEESVSLEGNSGPYLQYAHARACSILRKAGDSVVVAGDPVATVTTDDLQPGERTLLRKLSEYSEAVDKAVSELMPHHVCTYLYDLAQTFNRFYENNLVVGDPRQAVRLDLVRRYVSVLRSGLGSLGIDAPEQM